MHRLAYSSDVAAGQLAVFQGARSSATCGGGGQQSRVGLWRTVIGKKGVMAVTGVVLIGFVIARRSSCCLL
jgi:hypothetical protein